MSIRSFYSLISFFMCTALLNLIGTSDIILVYIFAASSAFAGGCAARWVSSTKSTYGDLWNKINKLLGPCGLLALIVLVQSIIYVQDAAVILPDNYRYIMHICKLLHTFSTRH